MMSLKEFSKKIIETSKSFPDNQKLPEQRLHEIEIVKSLKRLYEDWPKNCFKKFLAFIR